MLSSGVIKRIVTAENDNLPQNPTLQILTIKKLQAAQGLDRYRVILSDGVHFYTSGLISTQLNEMVIEHSIDTFAVIQLLRYTCNIVQGARKVIVILDMKVIQSASEVGVKLGSPQQMSDQISVHDTLGKETKNPGVGNAISQPKSNTNEAKTGGFYNAMPAKTNMAHNMPHGGMVVHPINSLTPYQNKWTIRARVTRKAPIRTWSNSKGEGRLFSVDLLDESGEIKATGFNQAVDKFYELLETGKVYYITKGSLRTANKQFTSIKNDYEMYLNNDTTVELCTENVQLPTANFNFINIIDIENTNKDALIDVIGIVKATQDCVQITTRSTNRQLSKRDIQLIDKSMTAINVTLWGEQAEQFDEHANGNPIIALKGAKVSDFGGRSLSVLGSSMFLVNPDIPNAHALRGWYDSVGKDTAIKKTISGKLGGGMNSQHKTIGQMRAENLGMGDKADYFATTCTVAFVRKENSLYKACPSSECNKKVVDEGGEYRCEKCNRTYPDFKYRLIMSANIFDCTGNQWVTCFQEGAEAILGQTAENIGRLRDEDDQAYNDIFEGACFKFYNMKLRAKVETYNDESRFKVICVSASPMNFVTESKRLLEKIKELEQL